MVVRPTAQLPHYPKSATVSNGDRKPVASVLTWLLPAWASDAALVIGREKVTGGWRGFHPGGSTVPHWRPDLLAYKNLASPCEGVWDADRTGHPLEGNPGLPGQKRAVASAVTSCGFEVVYGRVGSHG